MKQIRIDDLGLVCSVSAMLSSVMFETVYAFKFCDKIVDMQKSKQYCFLPNMSAVVLFTDMLEAVC